MFVLETMVKNSLLAWGGAVYLSIGHTVPSTNTIEESIPVWHRPTINYCGKTKATAAFQSAAPVDGAWCNSLGKRCKLHALTHRRLHYNPIWMRYGVKRPTTTVSPKLFQFRDQFKCVGRVTHFEREAKSGTKVLHKYLLHACVYIYNSCECTSRWKINSNELHHTVLPLGRTGWNSSVNSCYFTLGCPPI